MMSSEVRFLPERVYFPSAHLLRLIFLSFTPLRTIKGPILDKWFGGGVKKAIYSPLDCDNHLRTKQGWDGSIALPACLHQFICTSIYVTPNDSHMTAKWLSCDVKVWIAHKRLSAQETSHQLFSGADKWQKILPVDFYFLLLDIDITLSGTFIRESFSASWNCSKLKKKKKSPSLWQLQPISPFNFPMSTKVHLTWTWASGLVCCHDNRVPVEGRKGEEGG